VFYRNEKGAITIFLTIIILIIIVLMGVLVDGIRIKTAQGQIKRSLQGAIKSTLAGYDMELKEQYGLFALSPLKKTQINQEIFDYFDANLGNDVKDGQFFDLYDYVIEDINSSPMYNLTENEIIRNQIIQNMKYRAPLDFLLEETNFIKKVEATKQTANDSQSLKDKTAKDRTDAKIEQTNSKNKNEAIQEDKNRIDERRQAESSKSNFISQYQELFKNSGSTKGIEMGDSKDIEEHLEPNFEYESFEKESSAEKMFNFFKDINRSLENILIAKRDELYVGEYALDYFDNAVYKKRNARVKSKQNQSLDYQVEYVLYGKSKDQDNITRMKQQLLLYRFPINFSHVAVDPAKRAKTLSAATAIAAGLTGGVGIPFIQSILTAQWAAHESISDVLDLMKGKKVPLIKNNLNWKTDFIGTVHERQISSPLDMSYEDYLRIFLLLENSDKKMNRIEDLIQLSLNRRLCDFNTYIDADASVSMKYFFLTQTFMPRQFRTQRGDRQLIKVRMYEGY
jgi:hypothetical protein